MVVTEIMKDFYFIERGYLNANHFAFRAKAPILIDTGYSTGIKETEQILKFIGINTSTIKMIINTHSHGDHVGGNKYIQNRSGCEIAMHEYGRNLIKTRDEWLTWWKYYNKKVEFFDCTIGLRNNNIIPIGPYEFRVIHVPGHAADQIVLYCEKEKLLISSDALWENNLAVMTLRIEGIEALFTMEKSLEKLEKLDVKVVYPGHGSPFTKFKEAIEKSKTRLKKYIENKEAVGIDLVKKMIIFNLLMSGKVKEDLYFNKLMETHWFPDTVNMYFHGEHLKIYNQTIKYFIENKSIERVKGKIYTTIKA